MTSPGRRALEDLLASHELLPLAWGAAQDAGRFLQDERPTDLHIDTKSSATDSVTVMDRTAEAMIIDVLLGVRPADGFLGEEGGERTGTSGVRWVVDPLDGTVNYLHRIPMWGVSVAAQLDGVGTVGVIVTPEFDESYVGVRGGGAWLVRGDSAERITVSDCDVLGTAVVTTGFGYAAERRRAQAAVLAGLIGDIADVRRTGCAVIDLCWLARGRFDGLYEQGLNPWDYAAGALIAEEAGAVVGGLHDEDMSEFAFAATPGIAAELRAALLALHPATR